MNLLLDTHVWVWAAEKREMLGRKTEKLLLDLGNPRAVCTVSTLEIARLCSAGDLVLRIPLTDWTDKSLADLRADSFPVTHEIAIEAYRLPEPFHRDPADRQIVACARVHGWTVLTADERILAYTHVASVDARK